MTSYVRVLGSVAIAAISAMSLSACVVRAQARPGVYVTPTASATVVAQPTYVQQQPVYAQPQPVYARPACGACQQGSYERCNGCDDNCNGVIDEDCR